jgi:hypothetical protein
LLVEVGAEHPIECGTQVEGSVERCGGAPRLPLGGVVEGLGVGSVEEAARPAPGE